MASIQDNKNSKLDPALVDRAWTQMHQQLEVAMPQRKRRGFVWWWAFFALVGISLLAFFLWPTMNNTQNEEPGSGKEAVIAADPQVSNDQMVQPTNDQDAKHHTFAGNLPSTSEPTEPSTQQDVKHDAFAGNLPTKPELTELPIQQDAKDRALAGNSSTKPELIELSGQQASAHRVVTPNLLTTPEPSNPRIPEPSNRLTAKPSNPRTPEPSNRPTTEPFNRIPTINHQPSFHQPSLALSHQPSTAFKQSHWNYYLETQAGFSLGGAPQGGFSIGGGLQRLLTSKVKLEAGLQYQWQRSSLLVGNNSDDITETEALFDTVFPSPTGAYNPTLSTVTRDLAFNKLNLYVGGHFQVKPRLSFGLGGQASYFTQAYVVFDAGEVALAQGGIEGLNGNTLDLYGSDVSVYERVANTNTVEGPYVLDVRRWQVSVNTSIRYRFARHWETGLQYQAHLTSWPNQNLTFGGNSSVQLGLRYYLR